MRLFLWFLGFSVLTSCAPPVSKLVVLTDPHAVPMEFIDASKTLSGYDVDLVKAMAREGGFTVEFLPTAWEDLFASLERGQGDVIASSMVINAARQARYAFSDPYLNAGQVLVVPKGSPARRLSDLRGRPVGVLTGTSAADSVRLARGAVQEFNVLTKAFQALSAGGVSGVVTDGPGAARFATQTPRFAGAFMVVGAPLTVENYGFVVKKGNDRVLAVLNAALGRLKASGFLDELTGRWLR